MSSSGLGGVVGAPGHVSVDNGAGHGGGDNDRTRSLGGNHLSRGGLGGDKDTGDVDVHDLSEPVSGVLVARGSRSKHTGVSDDNVNLAVGLGNVLEEGVHSLLVSDVGSLEDQRGVAGHSLNVGLASQELLRGSLGHVKTVDSGTELGEAD